MDCVHPNDVLTKVIRELYAHLTSLNNAFIYVRGTSILFDPYCINALYALPDKQDEHTQFAAIVTTTANEDTIPNKGAITKKIVMRFLGKEMQCYPLSGSTSTSSTPICALAIPSTSHNAFEKHVLNSHEKLYK
ncbi:hypothetical protein J1N35_014228 [Gossypium stocksii]|uniref:Uncharacterized protein n=1 Tax=Gossypium stocksii TaxID=47602 RepID=A0A9D3VTX4_9ROSI|nr:hypothetical protein J1N35_014228 [Gossypium stocksii]